MMEGTISSITRRFFQKNGFSVISQSKSGKDIHYQMEIKDPPELKAPDIICYKDSTIIVGEQKIEYNKLFSGSNDVQKLESFLNSQQAKTDFLHEMSEFFPQPTTPTICVGFSSLSDDDSNKTLPTTAIQTGIEIDPDDNTKCTITLVQDGGLADLFPHKSLDMEI
jgi:hypothetical protein